MNARSSFLLGVLVAGCAVEPSPSLARLEREIRARYPEVRQLAPAELEGWLAEEGREPPVLLDAREPAEYAVSHLPGAVLAPDEEAAVRALEGVPRDRPVVVYCSVGYRSSDLARSLARRGFTDVRNLEGSIFRWAGSGREVVRRGIPVREVHPYDAEWGRLLDRELWAFEAGGSGPEAPGAAGAGGATGEPGATGAASAAGGGR